MWRSYEFKEESYIMHEQGSRDYPSYERYHEVPSPIIHNHKMLHKPSFQHSTLSPYNGHPDEDDMVLSRARWDDTPGWCGTHRHLSSANLTVKKNEHQASRVNYDRHGESHGWGGSSGTQAMKQNKHQQAMGAKSILRPPLGPVNPPSHHQYTMYEGLGQAGAYRDGRPYFCGEASTRQAMSMMVNNSNSNSNTNWMEASERFEDYYNHGGSKNSNWLEASKRYGEYNAQLQEELESLMKRLSESGFSGEVVEKIEVIEYERRSYGGGIIRAYPRD